MTSGGEDAPAVVSPGRRLADGDDEADGDEPGGDEPGGDVGPDGTGRGRLLGLATAAVTFLAIVFLAGAIADVPAAFSKVHGEDWLWLVPAIGSAAAVFFAAAVALSGAVDVRLPPWRTVLLEVGRSFTTMATPGGVGSFALTVRFVQRLGIEVAAASASAALVSVGSLLVDLVALVVGGILSASAFQTENLHSAAGSDGWLLLAGVVVLAAAVAAVWHFPRLHRRVVPQLKMAGGMVRSVARRPLSPGWDAAARSGPARWRWRRSCPPPSPFARRPATGLGARHCSPSRDRRRWRSPSHSHPAQRRPG